MLPPSLAAHEGHPLLTQQMSMVLRLRQPVKGCLPSLRSGGVREAVLVAARMVAVCWMAAIVGW
jgi:hypothetical protein